MSSIALTPWHAIAFAAMAGVWLVAAWIDWRGRRALPPALAHAQMFHLSGNLRWLGPLLLFLGPALFVPLLLLMPVHDQDGLPVVLLALFMGGICPAFGVGLMRAVFRSDAAGLVGYTAWGQAAFVAWPEVKRIAFSARSDALRFEGGAHPVYVAVQLHQWPTFVADIERRLPHLPLPTELLPHSRLRLNSNEIAFQGHWQGIYDQAARTSWISALVLGVSLIWIDPYWPAMALAALCGVISALYPLLHRLMHLSRKPASGFSDFVHGVGSFISIMLILGAYKLQAEHLGAGATLEGSMSTLIIVQLICVSVLVMAALILVAKWRWPQRFARERMIDEEGSKS